MPISSRATLSRMAWLVVALLWPVALLNYLDRQMLASMKYSVMSDIPGIGLEANWGFGLLRDRQVPLNAIFGVFASAAVLSVVLVLCIRPHKALLIQEQP